MGARLTKTNSKKKKMLVALSKSCGVVTEACKVVGISRITHYEWLNTDPDYKAACESVNDEAIDFMESALFKRIQEGSDAAIIFGLKTRGKNRGYVERQEITHDLAEPVVTMITRTVVTRKEID